MLLLLQARVPDFDLSNENVSLIRLSGEPGKLGMIIDANPAGAYHARKMKAVPSSTI